MITGDHPRTAARIAADLGIAHRGSRPAVAGAELDRLDEDGLRAVVRETSVYARVAPEHKLRIVDALQDDGNIVAMTGDGVNDSPALRSADIGVAMGVTGTDVSKEAADMILADDNFATIVSAVRQGRAIFANIRSFLRYLLSSNAGEVLTMFLGVLGAGLLGIDHGPGVHVPLLATQILWINLLTDTGPALAMGVDPPPDDVMARPPRRLTDRVIDGEMQVGIVLVGLTMAVATLVALDLYLPGGMIDGGGRHRRGPHRGLHDAGAGPALELLQRPQRPGQLREPPVHQPAAVGRHRAVAAAAGGGGAPAAAQRRVRHHAAVARPVGRVRRAGQRACWWSASCTSWRCALAVAPGGRRAVPRPPGRGQAR